MNIFKHLNWDYEAFPAVKGYVAHPTGPVPFAFPEAEPSVALADQLWGLLQGS